MDRSAIFFRFLSQFWTSLLSRSGNSSLPKKTIMVLLNTKKQKMGSVISHDDRLTIWTFFLVLLTGITQSGPTNYSSSSSSSISSSTHAPEMAPESLLWPRGIIPYEFRGFDPSSIATRRIDVVLREWQSEVRSKVELGVEILFMTGKSLSLHCRFTVNERKM